MRKRYYFTAEEKYHMMLKLTEEQKQTLKIFSKLSRESYFTTLLAKYKATERFTFEGFLDHGRVNETVKCMCGKSLRNEFSLTDRQTGEYITLGIKHFQTELDIPSHIAKEVISGTNEINFEVNEILHKVCIGDYRFPKGLEKYMFKIKLPKDLACLYEAGLPLLARHIEYLFNATKKFRIKNKPQTNIPINHYHRFPSMLDGVTFIRENYGQEIESYLLGQNKYVHSYNIITHIKGEYLNSDDHINGRHYLEPYLIQYLKEQPQYVVCPDPVVGLKFIHIEHLNENGLSE